MCWEGGGGVRVRVRVRVRDRVRARVRVRANYQLGLLNSHTDDMVTIASTIFI